MKTFIIAEAGVNHNGSLDLAKQLIDVAAGAGADAVKFQTFRAEALVSRQAPKADYQLATTGSEESQREMIKRLELDEAAHFTLRQHCLSRGIEFLSSPFDEESVDLLVDRLSVARLKLPSGEITNAPLLLKAARTGIPIILSTGMSTLAEVEDALGVLAFGYLDLGIAPGLSAFKEAFGSPDGQSSLQRHVTLLHCTTEYPAPFMEVNLRVMDTLHAAFGLPVGYSDHTEGIAIAIAAAACGATVIEKHFTLDRTLPGPDHLASLEPSDLRAMVSAIRQVEMALGKTIKAPSPAELRNLPIVRKSLVAAGAIDRGEPFTPENLTVKRPGTGVSPMAYWDMLGRSADRDYAPDTVVRL